MEPDLIIANIITEFTEIPAERVVLYDQNFEAPKDGAIFVVVSTGLSKIISIVSSFAYESNEEILTTLTATPIDIEITSKDRSAYERKEEIAAAFASSVSEQYQQNYTCRIFRNPNILDLSFVEASSALHRFQIGVIIHSMKTITKTVGVYDKFRKQEAIT